MAVLVATGYYAYWVLDVFVLAWILTNLLLFANFPLLSYSINVSKSIFILIILGFSCLMLEAPLQIVFPKFL